MERRHTDSLNDSPGLLAGLAAFVKSLSALLASRVELAALEMAELRDQLVRLLMLAAVGMLALLFALGCWTALLVVLAWDALGWKILLLVALLYSLLAWGLLRGAGKLLARSTLSLPATMAELRKDRDALL